MVVAEHGEDVDHGLAAGVIGEVGLAPHDVEQLRERVLVRAAGGEQAAEVEAGRQISWLARLR
jgi:hypothetical protein